MCSCRRPLSYPRGSFSVILWPPPRRTQRFARARLSSRHPLAVLNNVRLTYALTLFSRFPTHLSQPLCALDIFSRACRPSQTAHLPMSPHSRVRVRDTVTGRWCLMDGSAITWRLWHRRLPPTLHTCDQAPTADCSKALRGLHFPLEVSRLCTRK